MSQAKRKFSHIEGPGFHLFSENLFLQLHIKSLESAQKRNFS